MASSGIRRVRALRVTAYIAAAVTLPMVVAYAFWTRGVDATVPQSGTQDEPSPVFLVTPEPVEKVSGVIRVQTGPREGDLECDSKYTPILLEFNANQVISDVSVYTTFDSSGVRIYIMGTLPGDALIVNGHLTARALQARKLFLPNSSRFYPQGWETELGPNDRIILCRRELQA